MTACTTEKSSNPGKRLSPIVNNTSKTLFPKPLKLFRMAYLSSQFLPWGIVLRDIAEGEGDAEDVDDDKDEKPHGCRQMFKPAREGLG
jgi:hypothetical protein